MADITDPQTQQLFRMIIREETAGLQSSVGGIDDRVRTIVREETADMRDDISTIKQVQGQQGIQLRSLNTSVNSLKTGFRQQTGEMTRLGTLLEDLDDRFRAAAEVK